MVEVINMYSIVQMYEDDELTFNPNSVEVRFYDLLNLEFTPCLVAWS